MFFFSVASLRRIAHAIRRHAGICSNLVLMKLEHQMGSQLRPFSIMAMSCGIALVMVAGSAQAASDGTISFSGVIQAGTCAPDSDLLYISMPNVAAPALNESGKTAGAKEFAIALSGCPAGTLVRPRFQVDRLVDETTGMLKNSLTSGTPAQNVEIALMDRDGNVISIGAPQTEAPVTVDETGKAVLTYGAEFYAIGVATAGTFQTYLNYTIEYL
jgi:major type 1 subunit fimbrin (pilin)